MVNGWLTHGALQEWAREELAKLMMEEGEVAEEPVYTLNFLWLEKNIAVAVDQCFGEVRGQRHRCCAVPAAPRERWCRHCACSMEGHDSQLCW